MRRTTPRAAAGRGGPTSMVLTGAPPPAGIARAFNPAMSRVQPSTLPCLRAVDESLDQDDEVIRRTIDPRLKVKGKAERKQAAQAANDAIDAYNAALGQAPVTDLEQLLNAVTVLLPAVDGQAKVVAAIRAQLVKELDNVRAMEEVMDLADDRSRRQAEDPRLEAEISEADADFFWSSEVSHGANPLKTLPDGRSVGDALAQQGEIRNIHETHQSLVGKDTDAPKRMTAEVGTFYPERYRRDSFSRGSHDNETETKGLAERPPQPVLPKYAAVNLSGSQFGALDPNYLNQTPLHFALNDAVVRNRTTFTSSDSLRQWNPASSDNARLGQRGMVTTQQPSPPPVDDRPWQTGPIATYGSPNLAQVLADANVDIAKHRRGEGTNPDSYIEAQVHGELRLDRDVKHVRANFAQLFGNPRFESLYSLLRANEVPVYWYWDRDQLAAGDTRREPGVVTEDHHPDRLKPFARAHGAAVKIWKKSTKLITKRKGPAMKIDLEGGRLATRELDESLYAIWLSFDPQDAVPEGTDLTDSVIDDGSSSE